MLARSLSLINTNWYEWKLTYQHRVIEPTVGEIGWDSTLASSPGRSPSCQRQAWHTPTFPTKTSKPHQELKTGRAGQTI